MLATAAVVSTAFLYPNYERQQAAAAALDYAMNQPHDPSQYRYPTCHSRSHHGWGLWRSRADHAWYIVRPGREAERMIGDRSQYLQLRSLYCTES